MREILEIVEKARKSGKKIVTTNGCFDILHVGHVRLLEFSKGLGDMLVVGLNSDSSIKRIKGNKRPIVNEMERASMLASLSAVDYVVLFDEPTSIPLLEKIRPHVHVKGSDRKMHEIVERETVEQNGGRVILFNIVSGVSTTNLINRILELYDRKELSVRV